MANNLWQQLQAEAESIQLDFERAVEASTADKYMHPGEKRRAIDNAEQRRIERVAQLKAKAEAARNAEQERLDTQLRIGYAREAKRLREKLGDSVYAAQIVAELETLSSTEIAERHYWAPQGFDKELVAMAGRRIVAAREKAEAGNVEHVRALAQLAAPELPEVTEGREQWAALEGWRIDELDQVEYGKEINRKYGVDTRYSGLINVDDAHKMVDNGAAPEAAQATA